MTPEERATRLDEMCWPDGIPKHLVADEIREAVAAERKACADIATRHAQIANDFGRGAYQVAIEIRGRAVADRFPPGMRHTHQYCMFSDSEFTYSSAHTGGGKWSTVAVSLNGLSAGQQASFQIGGHVYTFTGPMQAGTIDANGKFTPHGDGVRPDPGDEQPPADDPIDYANRPARGGYF